MNERQAMIAESAEWLIAQGKAKGADALCVGVSMSEGETIEVRDGKVEKLNREASIEMTLTVYQNQAQASIALSDLSKDALTQALEAALAMSRYTESDPHYGLPDSCDYAQGENTLQLSDGSLMDTQTLTSQAQALEEVTLSRDDRLVLSDGASAGSYLSYSYLADSNGFSHGQTRSMHELGIGVIARDGASQQSGYAYDLKRQKSRLLSIDALADKACEKAVLALCPQKIKSGRYPVLFQADMARSLINALLQALSGKAQYRQLSFLHHALGKQILPDWLTLIERPNIDFALGSRFCDSEGVGLSQAKIIDSGVVARYLLSTYSARRLNMRPTGNSGGVANLYLEGKSETDLIKTMDKGVIITQLMGDSVNLLTGDYSRGARGLWVENGKVQYALDDFTIAGNLGDMFLSISAIGTDMDEKSSICTPSILLEQLTIASQ